MQPEIKKIVATAIASFLGAVITDIDKWKKSESDKFDWELAIKRWVKGAILGAMTGLGMEQM